MSNLRILFVEDNRMSSLISCSVLREVGYEVVEAYCADDAAGVIDRREPIAALVTDINLGPGDDGFEVARRARRAYPGLPVVFVSATEAARFETEGVEHAEFVAKPFHPQRIMEALDRTLPRGVTRGLDRA